MINTLYAAQARPATEQLSGSTLRKLEYFFKNQRINTMSKLRYLRNTALCATLLFGAISVSMAQTQSTNEIRGIGTGYAQDQFIAYAPLGGITAAANPAGCTNLDGYGAKIDYAGYKTHLSTVQLAFALGKPITVTVSNVVNDCIENRPRIIGVAVYR